MTDTDIYNGMPATHLGQHGWMKPWSGGNGGNCVEVADNIPGLVPVRDSKVPDGGPVLLLAAHAWAPFIASLK